VIAAHPNHTRSPRSPSREIRNNHGIFSTGRGNSQGLQRNPKKSLNLQYREKKFPKTPEKSETIMESSEEGREILKRQYLMSAMQVKTRFRV
jgi:hypothetical protein